MPGILTLTINGKFLEVPATIGDHHINGASSQTIHTKLLPHGVLPTLLGILQIGQAMAISKTIWEAAGAAAAAVLPKKNEAIKLFDAN